MSAAAAMSWALLVVFDVTGPVSRAPGPSQMSHQMTAMDHHAHSSSHPTIFGAITSSWVTHWALMVAAMMWPLYSRRAAVIARHSFRRWRVPLVITFVAVITALWLVIGLAAHDAYRLLPAMAPAWAWPMAWLAVAVLATRSMWRHRVLGRCQAAATVVAPCGRRGVAGAARAAVRDWPSCFLLCGPVMLAMVGAHELLIMVGGSVAVWWEQRHPHAWRDPVPVAALVAAAAGVAAAPISALAAAVNHHMR